LVVKGQIHSREDLTIEGEVEGTIEMIDHQLTIASTGNVRASVMAREVEVFGSIQGKVEALDKVCIRKGASFVGDIHSARIVIEDGGYVKAGVDLSRQPVHSEHEEGRWLEHDSPDPAGSAPIQTLSELVSAR
jgi:cytoskeletal protein CcmA (bactofilin family)